MGIIQLKLSVIAFLKDKNKILDFFEGVYDQNTFNEIFHQLVLSEQCQNYWLENKNFL